jgi:hypothetical protein
MSPISGSSQVPRRLIHTRGTAGPAMRMMLDGQDPIPVAIGLFETKEIEFRGKA